MVIEFFVVDRCRAQKQTKRMRTGVAHCRETDSLSNLDELLAEIGTEAPRWEWQLEPGKSRVSIGSNPQQGGVR